MDKLKLASGDNNTLIRSTDFISLDESNAEISPDVIETNVEQLDNSIRTIDDSELKLKERIAQCKDILTSLKLELNEEKMKLSKEAKNGLSQCVEPLSKVSYINNNDEQTVEEIDNLLLTTNKYTASVDSKLNCDENLLEYERQLQKYQNTLNMAQIEKKNAIRKQMLAKAFKLKLLEVENQCNIELIRIKQSLQCLEPLKLITEKWKSKNNDNTYDTFELIPRYPELGTPSGSDASSISNVDDCDNKLRI
ncbi:uncharacterized protein LOC124532458 [Vanessa cardui]|uniref:uncharacterized protein LOC124532458 n=1 Tax=Vanessa cardui TaxID=171605 RepID=UPI001F131D11|nr:uncharacterized protein LOC124532458 [Vanessa cardui]